MPIGMSKQAWLNNAEKLAAARLPSELTTPEYYLISYSAHVSSFYRSPESIFPFFQGGLHRFDPNTLQFEYFLKCDNTSMNNDIFKLFEYDGKMLIGGNFSTFAGDSNLRWLVEYDGVTTFSLFQAQTPSSIITDMLKTGGTAFGSTGDLYICGHFQNFAGNANSDRIVKWDGSSFSNLGTGLNNAAEYLAKDPTTGDIYVGGGAFTTAGGVAVGRLARWDGSSWYDVGGGFNTNNVVRGMEFDSSGNLYVCGSFTSAGGQSISYFAKWDGLTWSSPLSFNNMINSMYLDENSDEFYFLGAFTSIDGSTVNYVAKWDGTTVTNLNDGSSFYPTFRGSVGTFSLAKIYRGASGDVFVGNTNTNQGDVLLQKLGAGASGWAVFPINPKRSVGNIPRVRSWLEYQGKMYVSGFLGPAGGFQLGTTSSSQELDNTMPLAYYDRSSGKMNLTVGIDSYLIDNGLNGFWWDEHRERLLHYGHYERLDPDLPSDNQEKGHYWKNTEQEWEEYVRTNGNTTKPVRIGEYLYIGSSGTISDMLGNRIAKYDDVTDTYSSIGALNGACWTLTTDGTSLYAGGDFTTAGGVTVNRIAKYNGNIWVDVEGVTGANNTVESLIYATGDSVSSVLYAGGEFTSMQGLANTRGIAAYNPSTRLWESVGGGLGNGEVNSMDWDAENGYLFISGNFTIVGGQTIRYLAKWDGLTWSDVGGSDSMFANFAYVRSDRFVGTYFDSYGAKLYVPGQFVGEDTNTGKVYMNIMIWDGISWDNFPQYEGLNGHTGAGAHFGLEFFYPVPQEAGLTFPVYDPPSWAVNSW